MLDHDINPDDGIEQFMRQHYPGASKKFIAVVEREAVELRDRNQLHWLFDYINGKVQAGPEDKRVHDELAIEIEDDVVHELLRKTREQTDWEEWRRISESVNAVARYAALLLIEQAAWRKHDDATKASYEKLAAEEDLAG